jgi:hypothetical protein
MSGAPPLFGPRNREAASDRRLPLAGVWTLLGLLIAAIAAVGAFLRKGKATPASPSTDPVVSKSPVATESDRTKSKEPAPKDESAEPKVPIDGMRIAALAFFGVLTAVLAGLGIQGDILARLLRNEPDALAWAVVLTLVGGTAAAIALLWPKGPWMKWVVAGGALAALGGVCLAVWFGTTSFSDRETPSLNLSVVAKDASTVTLTADAAASSLRADETMLLYVAARVEPPGGIATPRPGQPSPSATERPVRFVMEEWCWSDVPSSSPTSVVLFRGTTGPSLEGVASTQWKSDVAIEGGEGRVVYICAKAIVSARPDELPKPDKNGVVTIERWPDSERSRGVVAVADLALVPHPSGSPTPIDR